MTSIKIEINAGDVIEYENKDYEVRAVGEWAQSNFNTISFQKMASLSVNVKGNPVIVDGKRGLPELKATGLKATPIDPVDPELAISMGFEKPYTVKRCYLADDNGFVEVFVQEIRR